MSSDEKIKYFCMRCGTNETDESVKLSVSRTARKEGYFCPSCGYEVRPR